MRFLVTNDDGIRSVFYPPLVEVAKSFGDTVLCLPAIEQSWKSKSITRFEKIKITEMKTTSGDLAYAVSGTPTDCTQIGYNLLCKEKPDFILSGINYGLNAGIGYLSSSGTVGAALEGNILGVPAIAVSQELSREQWQYVSKHHTLPDETLELLIPRAKRILKKAFEKIFSLPESRTRPVTWNINLPADAKTEDAVIAPVDNAKYKIQWSPIDANNETHFMSTQSDLVDEHARTDLRLLKDGVPTISVLDLYTFGKMKDDYSHKISSLFV